MSTRHFLTLRDLDGPAIRDLIERAIELKAGAAHRVAAGRTLGMIFQKSSTRTRVSFEVAMVHLGGHALFLSGRDTQLGRGEPVADTARVLSRMVDAVTIRNDSQAEIEEFSRHADVPVINALSDLHHPCQLLADLMTLRERRGRLDGAVIAWVGDGNNVCNSLIDAAALLELELRIACPAGYEPDAAVLAAGAAAVGPDADTAVRGADLVLTDVWASMGQEEEASVRQAAFADYQVNEARMALAAPDALFMHCLPAHRGEEVTAGVIDGPQSAVWDEAENRLHAQKALLEMLLG